MVRAARVLGAEALESVRIGVAKDARKKAGNGVDHHGCGKLASRQNVVADREFAVADEQINTLIDTLVPSAEEDHSLTTGEFMRYSLGERRALCGEQNDSLSGCIAGLLWSEFQRFKALPDWFRFEHHAFSPAEWTVIHGAVTIMRKGAEIVGVDVDDALFSCSTEDSMVEWAHKEGREDRNDVEDQDGSPSNPLGVAMF